MTSGTRSQPALRSLARRRFSTRTSKGLTVTKWAIKEVKRTDLALK
jgi:hypothetical protein